MFDVKGCGFFCCLVREEEVDGGGGFEVWSLGNEERVVLWYGEEIYILFGDVVF